MSHNDLSASVGRTEDLAILDWWREITREENRGGRAQLKRAKTLQEVLLVPAYHNLRHRLLGTRLVLADRVALVAALLARVDGPDEARVAARMAHTPGMGATRSRVSELRFRRLLQVREPEEVFRTMRRVIALLDGVANVLDLARSLYWWPGDSGDRTRQQWALAYYDALPRDGSKGA